uniref:Uncharacterized protein n=1 Tax=Anguilla anguilla TaxID=7936 RepID=A0A0E9W6Z8_ANGAN
MNNYIILTSCSTSKIKLTSTDVIFVIQLCVFIFLWSF